MRRSLLYRIVAPIVLVFGTVASAVLPIADSYAERAVGTAAHVEATGSEGCVPVHDATCDLCRVLRLPLTQGAHAAQLFASTGHIPATAEVAVLRPAARILGSVSPRAPPLG